MTSTRGEHTRAAAASPRDADPYADRVRIHVSACYDLLVSLRALFNPATYERTGKWAATVTKSLPESMRARGRFFFEGSDTALGYGAARLVPGLPDDATPADLVDAVAGADPVRLALFMLDTGETSPERLERFGQVLAGDRQSLTRALAGLPREWARRCRRVLQDPVWARDDLAEFLERYHTGVFDREVNSVTQTLTEALPATQALLAEVSTVEAIERLTGGYTLGAQLNLSSITLAPSVFMYPFMSTRVDETAGEALIIFGVPGEGAGPYGLEATSRDLTVAFKALSDANRLTVMEMLAQRPMFATELVEVLGLSQPTVHYHLTQLRSAGLIRQRREKGGMCYSLREDVVREIIRALDGLMLGPRSR